MPSALHHLSLKQKLILFSLVPLLMMSFFILTRMHDLIKESHSAKHNHLAVQTTVQISDQPMKCYYSNKQLGQKHSMRY